MERQTFLEWLAAKDISEATISRMRAPELDRPQLNKVSIGVGDMIDLGPETKFKGQKVPKYARVTKVAGNNIEAINLSSGDKMVIALDLLHEKPVESMPPQFQDDLKKMGANKMFEKLTTRQASRKSKAPPPQSASPDEKADLLNWLTGGEVGSPMRNPAKQKDSLKSLFNDPSMDSPASPEQDKLASLMAKEPEKKPVVPARKPLGSFIKKSDEPESSLKLGTFQFGN